MSQRGDRLFDAYIEHRRNLLNSLLLINSGAAVALISFLGDVKLENTGASFIQFEAARSAIISFTIGAAFAVIAMAGMAATEFINFTRDEANKELALWPGTIVIIIEFLSGGCFVLACLFATGTIPLPST